MQDEEKLDHIEGPLTLGQRRHIARLQKDEQTKFQNLLSTHKGEVRNIFTQYSQEVSKSLSKTNEGLLKEMNEALAKIDKRFSGMYGTLINQFLVKQESKVFATECAITAAVQVLGEMIYKGDEDCKAEFLSDLQIKVNDKMQFVANQITLAAEAQMKEQMAHVEETAEPVQEEIPASNGG